MYSNCCLMSAPSILISTSSGFFFGTRANRGWVAVSKRNSLIRGRLASIFLSPFSGSGVFGGVVRRLMSLGGFFIHVSVSVFNPYGVRW